jgi:hypothetical protein
MREVLERIDRVGDLYEPVLSGGQALGDRATQAAVN